MATTPIWHVVSALAVAGTLAVHGGPAHAAPRQATAGALHFDDGGETYRGYRIEMAQDVPNAELGQLRQAAEHQVDIVEATSLDEGTKAFLRRFPVVVRSGTGGESHYSGGDSVTIAVDDSPVVVPIAPLAVSGSSVSAAVRCGNGGGVCKGQASLVAVSTVRVGGRTIKAGTVLAKGAYRIRSGTKGTVKLHTTAAGRKALGSKALKKAKLTIGGDTRTVRLKH